MALRAFYSNPSIGGFGNENSATFLLGDPKENSSPTNDAATSKAEGSQSGDALCQIIKELVDNAVDACQTAHNDDDKVPYRVRVEVSPYNGSDDFLQVTVSDNGCGMEDIQNCVEAFQSSKGSGKDKTAGRYGLGLTLSMVHSQRLVPGKVFCCITSATKQAPTFRRQHYFVDTAQDKVQCDRDEIVPKVAAEVSGTCVSLLLPGGALASRAWKRTIIYLKRFHLSPVRCSIEVLAPTLEKLPIVVRSRVDTGPGRPTSTQDSSEFLHEGFASDVSNDQTAVTTVKNSFLRERKAVQRGAQKYGYFDLPLKVCNIARAENIIRQPGQLSEGSNPSGKSAKITVDIIVSPKEDMTGSDDGDGNVACMELVRMVNSVPLLDGVESIACGLVRALKNAVFWSSSGLTVLGGTESNEDTWINRFKVRDCDQVAPFFRSSTHDLWDCSKGEKCGKDDAKEFDEKKHISKSGKLMLPAKVRLGKILLLVNVQAEPSVIPMPTLTKGRLPVNYEPITQAFHLGIRDCLRNLQVTSPGLLLSATQLRSVERDVRYVPLLARASANLFDRLQNKSHQNRALALLKQIQNEYGETARDSNFQLSDEDIVRIIERKSRKSVLEAEAAKKQSKRSKPAGKADKNATDGYENIEDSDHCASDDIQEPFRVQYRPSPFAFHSLSKDNTSSSTDSQNPREETPAHINLQAGGIEIYEYEDDDEWW